MRYYIIDLDAATLTKTDDEALIVADFLSSYYHIVIDMEGTKGPVQIYNDPCGTVIEREIEDQKAIDPETGNVDDVL